MDISVVVPLFNEVDSLPELSSWIDRVMQANNFSYEVILVDDGSTDGSWELIEQLSIQNQCIKGIKFRRNYGKSAGLYCGFTEEKYDLVSGWKKKRYDPVLSKNIPSKFYNWTARRMTGIKIHDFNCGLKAYRKQVVKSIEVYGDMHRYIPVLAKWAGFKKIGEKVVLHQERKFGVTKFGIERFIRGPLDLLSVIVISKFSKRPMHFFGLFGTLTFMLGFAAAVWVGAQKLIHTLNNELAPRITESPYFYLSLAAMIIGTQLFLAGFLAELNARNSSERNSYMIDKRTH